MLLFLTLYSLKKEVSHVPKKQYEAYQHIKISILEWFLKDHKIQRCVTEINYILKYIEIGNQY